MSIDLDIEMDFLSILLSLKSVSFLSKRFSDTTSLTTAKLYFFNSIPYLVLNLINFLENYPAFFRSTYLTITSSSSRYCFLSVSFSEGWWYRILSFIGIFTFLSAENLIKFSYTRYYFPTVMVHHGHHTIYSTSIMISFN